MKKKKKFIILFFIIISVILGIVIYINYLKNKLDINFSTKLKIEVYDKIKISDLINDREIVDDYLIDTNTIGSKKIKFIYINKGFKYKDSFHVEVIDTISPTILLNNTYTIEKDSNIDLVNSIICGDNYTDRPNCYIEGDYDINKVGKYKLTYIGIDDSGNKSSKNFTLIVKEKEKTITNTNEKKTEFQDVIDKYKTKNTKIGIDVSKWQQDIDFKVVKEAGAEFVMIKIAGRSAIGSKIEIDPYFYQNIKGAIDNDLDVGVYFYSRATSIKEALEEANYVLDIINKYNISLGVAFDWENWSNFNNYGVSFHTLNNIAMAFMDRIYNAGYNPLLYGSEYYLKKIWDIDKYDIWLARYSDKVDYDKKYVMWQLSNTGKIEGIKGNVDIDVLYK